MLQVTGPELSTLIKVSKPVLRNTKMRPAEHDQQAPGGQLSPDD